KPRACVRACPQQGQSSNPNCQKNGINNCFGSHHGGHYLRNRTPLASNTNSTSGSVIAAISSLVLPASSA
ncbi:MAG: hypothetical protein ACKO9W_02715, partial [Bacteroidota bacterium]